MTKMYVREFERRVFNEVSEIAEDRVVDCYIGSASQFVSGQLESLDCEVQAMTKVLSLIISKLPCQAKEEIFMELGYVQRD